MYLLTGRLTRLNDHWDGSRSLDPTAPLKYSHIDIYSICRTLACQYDYSLVIRGPANRGVETCGPAYHYSNTTPKVGRVGPLLGTVSANQDLWCCCPYRVGILLYTLLSHGPLLVELIWHDCKTARYRSSASIGDFSLA